jgi:hypothetical protein
LIAFADDLMDSGGDIYTGRRKLGLVHFRTSTATVLTDGNVHNEMLANLRTGLDQFIDEAALSAAHFVFLAASRFSARLASSS